MGGVPLCAPVTSVKGAHVALVIECLAKFISAHERVEIADMMRKNGWLTIEQCEALLSGKFEGETRDALSKIRQAARIYRAHVGYPFQISVVLNGAGSPALIPIGYSSTKWILAKEAAVHLMQRLEQRAISEDTLRILLGGPL